jgi:phage-related protein
MHAARSRGQQAADRLQRAGLAGTVGADQAHQFALVDVQVDSLHGAYAAVMHLQAANFEEAHAGVPR